VVRRRANGNLQGTDRLVEEPAVQQRGNEDGIVWINPDSVRLTKFSR
jgi:hypothetical protein